MNRTIALDVRLLRGSGIGRHVDKMLGPLLERIGDGPVRLLAQPEDVGELRRRTGLPVVPLALGMYDPRVALLGCHPALAGSAVLWTPHFPHPVAGIRVVATVHDVLHLAHPEAFANPLAAPVAGFWLRWLRQRAAGIAFVSRFTADEFRLRVGTPRCPTALTPNAVDLDWWTAPPGPRPQPEPYLLALGNLKSHKGLDTAAAAVLADPALPVLLLLGDGPQQALPGAIGVAIAAGRVRCLGRLDDASVRCWLAHAVALVSPSFYEGFGIPPLEAMAVGTPVVARAIPAVSEVCGDAALLVADPEPAAFAVGLRRVIDDPILRKDLIGRGHARARCFSWSASAAALAGLIERAAG